MKILQFFLFLYFFKLVKLEDESWMKEIEFDGVLLKINERIFEHMMKRINYALVLFYEDNDKTSYNAQEELRLAAEVIVQMSPAVGVFKMKCSENPKFCGELKKEEIPFVIWINNNNFGIFKEPKERDNFINFCEKMTKFSSARVLDSREDIIEFLMNTNYNRLLGIFPKENSTDVNIFEELYENLIPNSLLSNSGEFMFGKIVRKELINHVNQDFDKTQNSILIFTKDELLNFSKIFNITEENLQIKRSKFGFISELSHEKFYPYYFNSTSTEKLNSKDKIINDIILNALPNIFPLDQKFYNLAFGGPIQKHFLLVIHPDHLLNFEILENYNNISRTFKQKNYEIWFTFSIFDNELKDMLKPELMEINKDEEKDFPVLLLFNLKNYAENNKEDVEKYFFNREITFENLERFYLRFHNVQKYDEVKHSITSEPVLAEEYDYRRFKNSDSLDIPKVVGLNFKELVFDFPDNVLVLFIDNDQDNTNLYRKWTFLLNKILQKANVNILRIYKYNAQLNDNYLTQVPHNFPSIKLYIRHNKDNPIEYTYGPSLLNLAKFLNELVPTLDLKVSLEEVQAYNQEIFRNPDYIEEQIFEIDDNGDQHLISGNSEDIIQQRGLDSKVFEKPKLEDSQKRNLSIELNKTIEEFAKTEELKAGNNKKTIDDL